MVTAPPGQPSRPQGTDAMTESLPAFTQADQTGFADLSGDWNPIHVDPVAARRLLFGGPVVHGVHLVLRSLEAVAGDHPDLARPAHLRATFRQPVRPGEAVELRLARPDGAPATITLAAEGKTLTEIALTPAADPAPADTPGAVSDRPPPRGAPRERAMADLEGAAGQVPLGRDPAAFAARFPRLAAAMPAHVAASLLAATRVVGMECPGLHSLFSELELSFDAAPPAAGAAPALAYRVAHASAEFRLLDIAVAGPGVSGTLRGFLRPGQARQLTLADAAGLVGPARFADRRALVVGGSRGLGEAAAKLLAAAGADVCLTYATGRQDAEAVAEEIRAGGGRARAAPLDVRDPAAPLPGDRFTHLYYFAAPRILPGAARGLDPALFAGYLEVFASAFAALVARLEGPLAVVYPSTIYVERPEPRFAEYAAAKAAGETLGRYIEAARPDVSVEVWRLPRMQTDQTQSLLGASGEAPGPALWRFLGTAG